MIVTAGIDVGTSSVKVAILAFESVRPRPLAQVAERFRRREMRSVVRGCYERALSRAGVAAGEVDYVAATGAADMVEFRRGHFFAMTSHARGANYLMPEARTALDLGALHSRAILMDERSRVLAQKMTAQCASGTGQFIENIARYLGIPLREVGACSLKATHPEQPSGICAVLAETDVVNMVSRGIAPANILKGIHLSIANRVVRLLSGAKARTPVLVTGGLSRNEGLVDAIREKLAATDLSLEIRTHPESVMAGALGAALWGEWRLRRLAS
ncbi:MAG: BadF/BadG/BcrA/BcrD ATPase family protein [Acidobacteriota bacterium]